MKPLFRQFAFKECPNWAGEQRPPRPQSCLVWPGPWGLLERGMSGPRCHEPPDLQGCPGDQLRPLGLLASRGTAASLSLLSAPPREFSQLRPPGRNLPYVLLAHHLPGAASGWSFQSCHPAQVGDCSYGWRLVSSWPRPTGQRSPGPFILFYFIFLKIFIYLRACMQAWEESTEGERISWGSIS